MLDSTTITRTIELPRLEVSTVKLCEAQLCAIPDHHSHAQINRRIDEDAI